MGATILLVEDDPELRRTLSAALDLEGYRVLAAASAADARALARHGAKDAHVVLLDLGLPDGAGEDLLTEWRDRHAAPVIVISAREAEGQIVRLLDSGADDYLVKPFGVAELLARIRSVLRRHGRASAPAILHYRHGALSIDVAARRVLRNGAAVHLTPTEFELLARLARQAGQILTHRQLLADVWGAEHVDQTHYLRLYMGQLRAKLEDDTAAPEHLITEPGVGYRIAEPDA